MKWEEEVVGTLSGDDTFLILLRTETDAQHLCQTLSQYVAKR